MMNSGPQQLNDWIPLPASGPPGSPRCDSGPIQGIQRYITLSLGGLGTKCAEQVIVDLTAAMNRLAAALEQSAKPRVQVVKEEPFVIEDDDGA